MKKILFLLLTIISFSAGAQVYNLSDYKFSNRVNIGKGGATMIVTDPCAMLELGVEGTNRTLLIPRGDTVLVAAAKRGSLHYRIADSSVYYFNGLKWSKLVSGATLSGYMKYSDTASLSNRIDNAILADLDKDPSNEMNTGLSITGNSLDITDAGGTLSTSVINSNNLSLTGNSLECEINGVTSNAIDLSGYSQTLSIVGNDLTISGGNTVTLPSGGGGSSTADNGLTATGSNIQLGGSLIQNTQIYGLNGLTLGALPSLRFYSDTLYSEVNGFKYFHHYHKPSVSSGNGTYPNLFTGFKSGQSLANSGYANTSYGCGSSYALNGDSSNASSNTVDGYFAMNQAQYALRNTVSGAAAMSLSGTGSAGSPITGNCYFGHHAGKSASGNFNVGMGASALENAGSSTAEIVAIGYNSGKANNATQNTLIGSYTAYQNTTANKITAIGFGAMQNLPAATAGATENTAVGALAMGSAAITGGYNTAVGAGSGKNLTSGNTNAFFGRESGTGVTTGLGSVAVGNNAMNTGNYSNSIVIGRTINVTGDNQLNIGGALFAANIYATTPRFALGKVAGTGSTFDMGGCTLPMILPKNSSTPVTSLETGMIYYNSTTNNIDFYDGSWGAIQRKVPTTTTTSASGVTWNSTINPRIVLNATSNAITQTIPAHSTSYTGWEVRFEIIGAASNAVTFSIPSSAFLNGVTGSTSFTPANGKEVTVMNDGTQWIITY